MAPPMRRALSAAALLALAACSVKLDGGRCQSDQNCLDDERCDPGAGRCVRCVPDPACAAPGTTCTADGSAARTCARNAGTCLYLAAAADCAGAAKTCGTRSGTPACECPANSGPNYYADADSGSLPDALPYATGAQSPPECRFKTLGQALAKATAYGQAATVRATGAGATPMVFSKAKGETFPLEVTPGVTLATTDSPPVPANYVISVDDASAPAGVDLHDGAAFLGMTVQSAGAMGDGVRLVCTVSTASPLLQSVKVDGATMLAHAVNAGGSCGAQLTSVDAGGATAAALLVDLPTTAPAVSVMGGLFHTSKVGIQVNQGNVTLTSVEVANNTSPGTPSGGGAGIRAGSIAGAAGDIVLSATGLLVHDNDDTGIQLLGLTAGSTVSLVSSDIYLNKALTAASAYGPGLGRKAGGLLLWGQAPATPLTFQKNRVYRNLYDQVGVYSGSAWSLNSGDTSCLPPGVPPVTANVFTCGDLLHAGSYLIYSTGGAIDALRNVWQTDPVPAGDVTNGTSGTGLVTTSPTCGASSIACP